MAKLLALTAALLLVVTAPASASIRKGPYSTRGECEEVRAKYAGQSPTSCINEADSHEAAKWFFYIA